MDVSEERKSMELKPKFTSALREITELARKGMLEKRGPEEMNKGWKELREAGENAATKLQVSS
jgi:hypothetical protein